MNAPAAVRAVILSGIAAVLAAGPGAGAQEPAPAPQGPTFGARVDAVQFDVSVLDEDGQPVRGLTAGDFTVLEDGVAQPIVAFEEVVLPSWTAGGAAWLRDVAPDVVSNRRDARRAVVIVMDDFSTRWGTAATRTAREIANAAVDHLGPADLASVVYVVNRRSGQEFTTDRARLREAIERFLPSGLGPQPDSRMAASNPGRGLEMPARSLRSRSGACLDNCIVQALSNAARILQSWPGARKTLLLISPGSYTNLEPADLETFAERHPMRELFAALQQANITVYELDPHGLEVEFRPAPDFGEYANSTGGRTVSLTNAPEQMIPQIFRENGAYYLLGFQPANDSRDGSFRRVRIQVNRPGVQVRTRSGYYAPGEREVDADEPPLAPIDQALSAGLPTGDLPLSLTVVPVATGERQGAAVAVLVRAEPDSGLAAAGEITLAGVAFDTGWREAAAAAGRFVPPATGTLAGRGAEMGLRLDLRPGRYEIRAAVTSPSVGRTGSVYASVTVPDFDRARLALSGALLERQSGGVVLPDAMTTLLPAHPTTERTFAPGGGVAAVMRVYQKGRRRPEPVRVTARIVDAGGALVFGADRAIAAESFGREKQVDYRLDLPLDRLEPGEHLLALEATSGEEAASREVRFTVRGE